MAKIYSTLDNFRFAKQFAEMFSTCEVVIDEQGIIRPDINSCPKCDCNLQYNGYNVSNNKEMTLFGLAPKKGKVTCSNPACDYNYCIPQSCFHEWTEGVGDWFDRVVLSLRIAKLSPSIITQHLEEVYGAIYSSEYIRLKVKALTSDIDCPTHSDKPSGVIVHDEQFLKIKGVDLKRISAVDANNQNVYYDKLHVDRCESTQVEVCQEVKKETSYIYAGVMDGLIAAKNAYRRGFGKEFKIQNCLFHYSLNLRAAYKEDVGYGVGKACLPIEHIIGFFNVMNIFFNHDREVQVLRKLQEKLIEHIDRLNASQNSLAKKQEYIDDYKQKYSQKAVKYLQEVRKARRRVNGIELTLRTEDEARVNLINVKLETVFPKAVQKQIDRLEKDWENFTHCLRDNTIPPTSNKVEQYYSLTLNWIEKNNLQSEEEFYNSQKFNLIKRYGMPLFNQGAFTKLLSMTAMYFLFFKIT